ncbi:MAG: sensor histidine kinase [Microbacteriaceae bacterium]|nr:sensor histidine kinase [Microbacteriaceae bacterium]
MLDRLRRWWHLRIGGFALPDLVLAAAATIVAVASVLTGNPDEGPTAITLPVALVTTIALIWRTRAPWLTAALVLAAGLVQTVTSRSPGSLWALVVLIIVMYSIAAHHREGVAALIGIAFVAILLIEERIDNGPDYLFIAVLFGGTWLLGRASRLWRGRVTRAEREKTHLARLAVADERIRIARELHDIVAHSLSVISVQSDAAAAALDHDPARAREPLRVIGESARRSLHEMREVLHLLRTGEGEPLQPAAGLDAVAGLIEDGRRRGLDIESELPAAGTTLPAVTDLAAYRIVQEALTNAVKHAPGSRVRVRVRPEADLLDIEVVDDGGTGAPHPGGSGVGLVGIRERAEALRGTFEAGRIARGFRVHVTLPIGSES